MKEIRKMTNEERDYIVMLADKNVSSRQICDILKYERSIVNYVLRFNRLAKANDIKGLKEIRKKHEALYQWVIKKYDLKIEEEKVLEPVNTINEVSTTNEKIIIELLSKLADEIHQTNSLLTKLL